MEKAEISMSKPQRIDEKSRFVRLERTMVEEISQFLFCLGNQFVTVKNAEGAFDCFKYSLDLNPKHQPSCYNLGALYNITGNMDGAYRMFKESVRMKPDDLVARVALGEVARKLCKLDESRKILEAVYKEDPDNYMVMSAMAILHYDSGHLAEAMEWNERALEKRPGDLHMTLNRALINMTFGDWPKWWSSYEFCLSYQKNERMRGLKMSDAWSGQELPGKSLLVISDQGSGDAIQFSRYLREAKELGKFGKVIYLVQPDLIDLLVRVDGVDEVVGFGERMKLDFDAFSSLLGVMRVLQISPENCWRPPHIETDPKLDDLWKHRIGKLWDGESRRVGIVWAGDPKHGNDVNRSLQLQQLLPLTRVDGVQLFSFQVGTAAVAQLASDPTEDFSRVVDLGSDFRSFDDTASALRQMDLLVTCDTAVGHLAGCLGVKAWWMIPSTPEWRHGLSIGTSYWYKESRLFRQPGLKDWPGTIEAVVTELRELVKHA
jgi:tetratricopeptide (TPR) repeat protein